MFPRTIENRLKMGRYVPILRHQSARIEPCGDGMSFVQTSSKAAMTAERKMDALDWTAAESKAAYEELPV